MNVLEVKCLRNLVAVTRMDIVWNDELRSRCGWKESLLVEWISVVIFWRREENG